MDMDQRSINSTVRDSVLHSNLEIPLLRSIKLNNEWLSEKLYKL